MDHVGARQAGERDREGLFEARLRVGDLGVGHCRCHAARKLIETGHLGGTGHHQGDFRGASAHGTGSEVDDNRPGGDTDGMAGGENMGIRQSCEDLGDHLDKRSG